MNKLRREIVDKIADRTCRIGVIGLGYVGIPLMLAAVGRSFNVIGFDIDENRVAQLNAGKSCIRQIPDDLIDHCVRSGQFTPTTHFERLSECDAILIAVPTPLTKNRDPDLTFVISTAETICGNLRSGQLIILESTTWPGTTDEVVKPILESAGLRSGQDFFLAFSPEREDPGNALFETSTIPKVVGGDGEDAMAAAQALYDCFVEQTVPVSSTSTAEAVKLTENIFRAVNIALVNELKIVYGRMGIDVWEVINAAKTKPFGFMPFYPGPGLGGHCIPIDPFYLTWKAREFDITTRFIELAGQINSSMPKYVVSRLSEALDQRAAKGINGARVLLIGMAYKKNVDDMRESPSLRFIEMLEDRGAAVDYHDPYIPVVPMTREHSQLAGRKSVDLTGASVAGYDVVLISTDHDGVDWELLSRNASLIVDSRNAMETAGLAGANVVKA